MPSSLPPLAARTNRRPLLCWRDRGRVAHRHGVDRRQVAAGDVRHPMAVAYWKPLHSGEQQNMSVAEAMRGFPGEAGISRYGQPEEIAKLPGFIVSPSEAVRIGPPE